MSKCKYYLEKEVVSYDGGITWNETGVTRKGNLYEESSEDCTDPSVQYRWINMDVTTDYICDGTNKYYKQKKQVSYDGIIWQDVTPAEYQRGSIYEVNSPDCQPTYRWVNMDITTDWICDETTYTKYYKQKKQVSYGGQEWQDVIPYEYQRGDVYETESTDCGYTPIIYRWVNMDISTDYICDGTTKYYKQKKQISFDGGQTWADVTPAVYQRGDVYETESTDCGYVPPTPTGIKFQATYSDGSTYSKKCDQYTNLSYRDTKPSGYEYSAMTTAAIGDCVIELGFQPFYACSSLIGVNIPNSVTTIGELAFGVCRSLTGVTIPNSVTSIGNQAFLNCSNLTGVTIPNSVTSIGEFAFDACRSLTSVTIPNSITSISHSVFAGCSGLTSVTIPNSVTSIGSSVFFNCISLPSINIPNGVTSIGEAAFSYCRSLTSIIIPSGVTSIGDGTFNSCTSLTSIDIPNSVTSIGQQAFQNCSKLTSINIPSGVTSIGASAFSGCTSLTSVTIPNSVTSIGKSVFLNCSGLTSVTIGNSVTSIGESAFEDCSGLTSIVIPDSVTSIGKYAFISCSGLTGLTCLATTPPTLGSGAFDITNKCPIYVPASSVGTYKSASGWSSYSSRIQAIP